MVNWVTLIKQMFLMWPVVLIATTVSIIDNVAKIAGIVGDMLAR